MANLTDGSGVEGESGLLGNDPATLAHLSGYLEEQGLSRGKLSPMSRLLRGLPTEAPVRITELPSFVNLHYLVARQLQVSELDEGFLSPCADWHRDAELGIYGIELLHPGYGPGVWGGAPGNPPPEAAPREEG